MTTHPNRSKRGPGRPAGSTKPEDERAIRLNITLSPEAAARLDQLGPVRSQVIERLIMAG